MFQFLFVFGPAAVTYLISQRCSCKTSPNWYTALIEMICYGALDTVVTTFFLLPFGRVELVGTPTGLKDIQYGGTAFVLSMVIGVIGGLVVAMLKKYADVRIDIEPKRKATREK